MRILCVKLGATEGAPPGHQHYGGLIVSDELHRGMLLPVCVTRHPAQHGARGAASQTPFTCFFCATNIHHKHCVWKPPIPFRPLHHTHGPDTLASRLQLAPALSFSCVSRNCIAAQGPDIIKDHKGVFVMEKMMRTLKVILSCLGPHQEVEPPCAQIPNARRQHAPTAALFGTQSDNHELNTPS